MSAITHYKENDWKTLGLFLVYSVLLIAIGMALEFTLFGIKTVTNTVNHTVIVHIPPASCLHALDEADAGFVISGRLGTSFSNFASDLAKHNPNGMQRVTTDITSINNDLDNLAPRYNSDKTDCQHAGR